MEWVGVDAENAGRSPARVLAHVLDMIRIKAHDPSYDIMANYLARPAIEAGDASKEGPSVYRFLSESALAKCSGGSDSALDYAFEAFEALLALEFLRFSDGVLEFSFISPLQWSDVLHEEIANPIEVLSTAGLTFTKWEGHVYLEPTSFYMACACAVYWLNLDESFFSSVFAGLPGGESILQALRLYLAAFSVSSQNRCFVEPSRGVLNYIVKEYIDKGRLDVFDNAAVKSYLQGSCRTDEDMAAALKSIKDGLPDFASNKGPGKDLCSDDVFVGYTIDQLSQDDIWDVEMHHDDTVPLDDSMVFLKSENDPQISAIFALKLEPSAQPAECSMSRDSLLNSVMEPAVMSVVIMP